MTQCERNETTPKVKTERKYDFFAVGAMRRMKETLMREYQMNISKCSNCT